MDIPQNYRRLAFGEVIQAGDQIQYLGESNLRPAEHIGATIGSSGWKESGISWQILRKIKEDSPWISVKDRLPEKEDWYFVQTEATRGGAAYYCRHSGWEDVQQLGGRGGIVTRWMPIPESPESSAPPITINESGTEREIQFNSNGSINVGCVTVDSGTFEAIVERRKEAMQ